MKKLIVTLLVVVAAMAAPYSAKAIEDPFQKGTLLFGLQAGYYPYFGGNVYGDCVIVDSWWKGHFTVGAQIGTMGYNGYKHAYLSVAPRVTYGLNITDRFEVHVGTLLGLGTYFGHDYKSLHLCYGGLTGLRFFLTDALALSAEVNYTGFNPWFNAGLAFKF